MYKLNEEQLKNTNTAGRNPFIQDNPWGTVCPHAIC